MAENVQVEGKQVLVKTFIEMAGTPKEHIEKTLKDFVENLKEEKEYKVLKEEYHKATKEEKYFTAFVELTLLFENVNQLLSFCFDAMPSSVDIIEPVEIKLPSADFAGLMNDLQGRLHDSDLLVKSVRAQNQVLDKNAMNVLRNFIHHLLKEGPKNLDELSVPMGVKPKQLEPFVKKIVADGRAVEENNRFQLVQ